MYVHSSNEDNIIVYLRPIDNLMRVVVCLFVCLSVDVKIFVLRLILKVDMFFMTVKCIRKKVFKVSQIFCVMGFWP